MSKDKLNEIQYDCGSKQYYWIDEDGTHQFNGLNFILVKVVNAIIKRINQIEKKESNEETNIIK